MKNLSIIAAVSITLLLTGCKQNGEPGSAADDSAVIATVNGKPVTEAVLKVLETEIAQRNRGAKIPKEQLIEELINRELLYQEAEKKQLEKEPDVASNLKFLRLSLLSQADIQDFIKNNPVTEEEIKAEYEKMVSGPEGTEYKARHILVKTEDEAKTVIAKLQKGEKFEELAKTHSTGPSKTKGGDLGWFSPNQMVPPFSEAVGALKKDEYTTTPVKTQFGWHVILLEDSRKKSPPAFDSVKARIRSSLQMQKIQKYIEELRKNATIVMVEPEKSEGPEQAEKKPETSETAKPDAPATKTQPKADSPTPAEKTGKTETKADTQTPVEQADTKKEGTPTE